MATTIRGRRRAHRKKAPETDPLIRVDRDRLVAAIEAKGSLNEVAREAKLRQSSLYWISSGRNARTHRSSVHRLCRVLGVPAEWLTGQSLELPGVRQRWEDPSNQKIISRFLRELREALEARDRIRVYVSAVAAQRVLLGWWDNRPRYLGDAPMDLIAQLGEEIEKLLEMDARRKPTTAEVKSIIPIIDALLGAPDQSSGSQLPASNPSPAYNRVPARAQLAEFRLRTDCREAIPGATEQRKRMGTEKMLPGDMDFDRDPWRTDYCVSRLLDNWLVPEYWRERLGLEPTDRRSATLDLEDWDSTTQALAGALRCLLRPWLEGRAKLNSSAVDRFLDWLGPSEL